MSLQVGSITKLWAGLLQELAFDAEGWQVDFGDNMTLDNKEFNLSIKTQKSPTGFYSEPNSWLIRYLSIMSLKNNPKRWCKPENLNHSYIFDAAQKWFCIVLIENIKSWKVYVFLRFRYLIYDFDAIWWINLCTGVGFSGSFFAWLHVLWENSPETLF